MQVEVNSSNDKLTDFGQRLDELAEAIKEPMSRILLLEDRATAVEADLHNKVSNHDLYHQLAQKTSVEKSQAIE